jgi:hypothetical protein
MKKFALLLVAVLFVLSCKNNSRLLIDVREVDFVNKSDVTLKGVPLKADWPIDIRDICVCDSFLLVETGEKINLLYVYSDELELKGRFCSVGRARNEFLSKPYWSSVQILRNAQGDALLPLLDNQQGIKVVDLQKSLAAESAVIASQNGFNAEYIHEYESQIPGRIARLHTNVDYLFLDDDINYRLEYYSPLILDDNEVHRDPYYAVTRDSALIKEIRLFSKFYRSDMNYVGGEFFRHPSRNLIVQLFAGMDYIMFFDLDNDRNYAIHQSGSLTFDDDLPEIIPEQIQNPDGTFSSHASTIDHFMKAAWAESFFMVTYGAGDYYVNQPDQDSAASELLFFDYDGNFLKSVKLDTHVSRMTYDEKNHILYTVDFNTESIYSYDLVSFV